MTGRDFAIVGGGMLGLTLALRLGLAGRQVTLLERAPHPGGLADPWELGGVRWDRHYHVVLLSDRHLRRLLGSLGLDEQVQWVHTRSGAFVDGRLHSVSNSLELALFPALGLIDKARLSATVLAASRREDGRALEGVPVEDWLVRWSGRRAFQRFWLPLLRSKLGDTWRDTSATFIWATLRRLYAARRSGLKEELFGYVPGGYATILGQLQAALARAGVELRTGCEVAAVEPAADGLRVRCADGLDLTAGQVVVTTPAPVAALVCACLTDPERERLARVEYLGLVCASALLSRPLSPFYVTNLLDQGLPFTGVIEMSALVDRFRELDGRGLVYLPAYLAPGDPRLNASDQAVRADFLAGLRRVHPTLTEEDVLAFRVAREPHVMARPVLNRSRGLPPVRTSVPGLFLVNSAHILDGTLNVDETVRLAERAARAFLAGQPGFDPLTPDPEAP
jgi:protoporphyrinogen oxidase